MIGAEYRDRTDVNYSPPAWKAGALPTELTLHLVLARRIELLLSG
jgi:hypothetical protein